MSQCVRGRGISSEAMHFGRVTRRLLCHRLRSAELVFANLLRRRINIGHEWILMEFSDVLCALMVWMALAAGTAQAQQFPSKPIRILIPFTAGGTNDILARTLGPKLSEAVGQ